MERGGGTSPSKPGAPSAPSSSIATKLPTIVGKDEKGRFISIKGTQPVTGGAKPSVIDIKSTTDRNSSFGVGAGGVFASSSTSINPLDTQINRVISNNPVVKSYTGKNGMTISGIQMPFASTGVVDVGQKPQSGFSAQNYKTPLFAPTTGVISSQRRVAQQFSGRQGATMQGVLGSGASFLMAQGTNLIKNKGIVGNVASASGAGFDTRSVLRNLSSSNKLTEAGIARGQADRYASIMLPLDKKLQLATGKSGPFNQDPLLKQAQSNLFNSENTIGARQAQIAQSKSRIIRYRNEAGRLNTDIQSATKLGIDTTKLKAQQTELLMKIKDEKIAYQAHTKSLTDLTKAHVDLKTDVRVAANAYQDDMKNKGKNIPLALQDRNNYGGTQLGNLKQLGGTVLSDVKNLARAGVGGIGNFATGLGNSTKDFFTGQTEQHQNRRRIAGQVGLLAATAIGGMIADNKANEYRSEIKGFDDLGGLDQIKRRKGENVSNARRAGAFSGASTGMAIGAGLMMTGVGAPVGAALIAGGAIIGGITGASAGAQAQRQKNIQGQFNRLGDIANAKPDTKAGKLQQQQQIGLFASQISRDIKKNSNLTANGKFSFEQLLPDWGTRPQQRGNFKFGKDANAYSQGDWRQYVTFGMYGSSKDSTSFQQEYAKALDDESATGFLGAQGARAKEIAQARIKAGSKTVEGDVRNQLTAERTQQLIASGQYKAETQGKYKGRYIEAEMMAARQVSEELRKLGLASESAYDPLKEFNKGIVDIASRLQQSGPSIVKFMSDFSDSVQKQSAIFNSGVAKRELGSSITSGIFGNTQSINTANLSSAYIEQLQSNITSSGSARDAGMITKNALSGFMSQKDASVFSDIAQLQRGLGGINSSLTSGLGSKQFQSTDQVERAIGDILPGALKAQGINLQTDEGKDLFSKIKDKLVKATETEGGREQFNTNRSAFIDKVMQDTGGDLKEAMKAVELSFKQLQEELNKSNESFAQFRSVQQSITEYQQSVFTTSLGRIQESSTIGASSGQISAGLSGIIGGMNPNVLNGTSLSAAGAGVTQAQQRLASLQQASQQNPYDPNLIRQANSAQQDLVLKQDAYAKAINDSNNAIVLFRARIEETTKQFNALIEMAAGAGRKSTSDVNRDRFSLGQFNSFAGGAASKISGAGITTAEQFFALSQKEQERLGGEFDRLAGNKGFLSSLETAGQYGSAKLKGTNIEVGELKKIAEARMGFKNMDSMGIFDDTGARTSALGKSRQEDFAALGKLQDSQLQVQDSINKSVLGIYSYLVGRGGTQEEKNRLKEVQSSVPTLNLAGGTSAGGAPTAGNSKSLQESLDRLSQILTTVTGQKTDVKFDGNVKIDGLTGDSKAATGQIVIMFLNEFLKQMDRSDPTQAQLADKLQAAIKTMTSTNTK